MDPTRTPQTRLLMRFRSWWKGNWSKLPSWWKVRSRGEYVKGIAAGVAFGLLLVIGQSKGHGQSVLSVMPGVLVITVLVLAVVIPATFAVARMSYRKHERRKHHG